MLFANLQINEENRPSKLSLLNEILPIGYDIGVLVGYIIKLQLTYKQCLQVADDIRIFSLLASISNYEVIFAVRFFLGISNEISNLIMPVYIKSLCHPQDFSQMSMQGGYEINTRQAIGQLMGIGYIKNSFIIILKIAIMVLLQAGGELSVYFLQQSAQSDHQQSISYVAMKAQSNQLQKEIMNRPNMQQQQQSLQQVICQIYKLEYVEDQYQRYTKLAHQQLQQKQQSFFKVFEKQQLITLRIGIISMLVYIWCGSFAVFYYSAQIFSDLSDNDITQKIMYTISLGLLAFLPNFRQYLWLIKLEVYIFQVFQYSTLIVIGSWVIGSLKSAFSIIS